MAKIVYVELTFDGIEKLLREAAEAHHAAMGDAEDDWAKWYAHYIWGKTADDHKTIDTVKDTKKTVVVPDRAMQLKTDMLIDEDFDADFDVSEERMMSLIDG